MTKKTIATIAPEVITKAAAAVEMYTEFQSAIAEDIKLAVKTMTSGKDVAAAFDTRFPFDWTRFKGNASAEKCGMSKEEFKAVRDARTEYRDAWNSATDENGNPVKLYSFDRRWQYVAENSVHAPQPENEGEGEGEGEGDSGSAKTKLEQCITALQNALRYATHEEFSGNVKTADKIRAALKANGITEDSAE